MKIAGIKQDIVEVDIIPKHFIFELFKTEFKGYNVFNEFKIDGNKLFVIIDTAYHGSPALEAQLLFDDASKVQKYKLLKKLYELY